MPGAAEEGVEKAFRNLLRDNRVAIVERWLDIVFTSYNPETAKFLRREKDKFSNPVGQTFARVLPVLFDLLVEGEDLAKASSMLREVMKIRAVQDFMPSQAVGFFFGLKSAVRVEIEAKKLDADTLRQLLEFESRIDALGLAAFDAHLGCREKIYEIKATELKRRSERVLQKLNDRIAAKYAEPSDDDSESSQHSSERGDKR